MPLPTGENLDPYEILAPKRAGEMGDVHKARDTRLDRMVAIKPSKTEFSERPPNVQVLHLPSDFSTAEAGQAGVELVSRVQSLFATKPSLVGFERLSSAFAFS